LAEIVVAGDAQKRERDHLAHEAWGQKLTIPEFVAREERLRAHPWARASMTTWLLVEDGGVLSSCETFAMHSFLDGAAGRSFGVASVYTEPALRGRGHAARMMQLLPREGFQAGILFSDVGDYYARFGWRSVPAHEWTIAPAVVAGAERLRADEIDQLWNTLDVPRTRFLVWPSAVQLDWHRERERAYAGLFGRAPLTHSGARSDGGVIAWAADFKNGKLVILHLQANREADTRALVAAAQAVAAEAGLAKVSCWDVLAPWPGDLGERAARTDSLPMVLPIAPGSESWSFVPRAIWI
jgi:hypothetical protein